MGAPGAEDQIKDAASGLAPDDPSFDISNRRDVEALLAAEERHFWHLSRNRIIASRLQSLGLGRGARVLELGCGSGCVAAHLGRQGYAVTGVDGHAPLLAVAASRAPSIQWLAHDLRKGPSDLAGRDFDAVCLFDVIEHLDDPVGALADAMSCARRGGFVVGTVPAQMALWSSIDEHAGHKIRYSRESLAALLRDVPSAKRLQIAPFNRSLVPLMWVQRRFVARGRGSPDAVRNLAVPGRFVNWALFSLVMGEHRLASLLDRTPLWGASLWFALEKG